MKKKHLDLRPNKTLSALLSGQRHITVSSVKDLAGVSEALAGMEEDLFPGASARRAEAATKRDMMPVEQLIEVLKLDKYFPQTLAKWLPSPDPQLLRQRIEWLYHFAQCGHNYADERLLEVVEKHSVGTPLWEICPIN